MLENKLVVFILKRILTLYILLSIIDIIFMASRWLILTGLTIGAVFGALHLNSTAVLLERILPAGAPHAAARTSLVRYVVTMVAALAILVASIELNPWIFAGEAAGILLLPFAIMVNGLTEGLGITHNKWQ